MYLSTNATFGTLRAVAALAPGTKIIFEYSVLKELVDEETQKMLGVVQTAAQAVPEDNKLRRDEIVLSRMLTSRLSERAVEGILRRKSEIDRFLPEFPAGVDLLQIPTEQPTPVAKLSERSYRCCVQSPV
jgi:hypothetical protein